jgi:hypothetical protein
MSKVENILDELKETLIGNMPREMLPYFREMLADGVASIDLDESCSVAERDHLKVARRFAHANHREMTICCCKETAGLSEENIKGLLVHEICHIVHESIHQVFTKDTDKTFGIDITRHQNGQDDFWIDDTPVDGEILADAIAERVFGVRIFYDLKKIQWADV